MKQVACFFLFIGALFSSLPAQTNATDSLALVALYDSTDGANWTSPWTLTDNVDTWSGIIVAGGRVTSITLDINNLTGTLPPQLADITFLSSILIRGNNLSGTIPTVYENLANLKFFNISGGAVTGSVPTGFASLLKLESLVVEGNLITGLPDLTGVSTLTFVDVSNNRLDFGDLEPNASGSFTYVYAPQDTIGSYMGIDVATGSGTTLTAAPGGTATTYQWSQDSLAIPGATSSTHVISTAEGLDVGRYVSAMTNSLLPNLTLMTRPQDIFIDGLSFFEWDSLALVALYDSTDGPNWHNNSNWLSSGVSIASWLGVTVVNDRVSALNLSSNNLTGPLPKEIGILDKLRSLKLGSNKLDGILPDEIGNLIHLDELHLFSNLLEGAVPATFGNFTEMSQILSLSGNKFTSLPSQLANLKLVTRLHINSNQFSGAVPLAIFDMTALETLQIDYNQFSGPLPAEIGNLVNLIQLVISNNQLTSIPPEISGLVSLVSIRAQNNQITSIPPQIGTLSALTWLTLFNNLLTSIPPDIGNLLNLKNLNLFNNAITALPAAIGNATQIERLTISNNPITELPSTIGALTALKYFFASNTSLADLPAEFSGLTALEILDINNNFFTRLPDAIGDLTSLKWFYFTNNMVDTLPDWIGNLTALTQLRADGNQITEFPDTILSLPLLGTLSIADNKLTSIPDMTGMASLFSLSVSSNMLGFQYLVPNRSFFTSAPQDSLGVAVDTVWVVGTGDLIILDPVSNHSSDRYKWSPGNQFSRTLTIDKSGTYYCTISNHLITGDLYTQPVTVLIINPLTEQDSLSLVDIYNSTDGPNWSTTITNWLSTDPISEWTGVTTFLGRVTSLSLQSKSLAGPFPAALTGLTKLTILGLSGNQLYGSIPADIGALVDLTNLNLSNNLLTGAIPAEIGNLPILRFLFLNGNALTDTIPSQLGNLSNLNSLVLYNNQIVGSIPSNFKNLAALDFMNISNNRLSGSIPAELSALSLLKTFWAENNSLTGEVPAGFTTMTNLTTLDIDNNEITGLPQFPLSSQLNLFSVRSNRLTFEDIAPNIGRANFFFYSPQGNVGAPQIIGAVEGASLKFGFFVGGVSNSYAWKKDGEIIAGEVSDSLEFSSLSAADEGTYHLWTTNSSVTGLVIVSHPVVVTLADATLPMAPEILTVISGDSFDEVGLVWSQNMEGDVRGYYIYGGSAANPTTIIDSTFGSSDTSVTLSGLSTGFTYFFRVTAVDVLDNESAYSNEVTAVPDNIIPPAPPRLRDFVLGVNSVTVSWVQSPEPDVRYYRIYNVSTPGAFPATDSTDTEFKLSATLSGLTVDLTYYLRVTAVDEAMNESLPSSEIVYVPVDGSLASDSLALVALYDSTNGAGWTTNTNWLTSAALGTWFGVRVSADRVTRLDLRSNNLSGPIPESIGDLTELVYMLFDNNSLSGSIPASIGNLISLFSLNLPQNQLTGEIPTEIGRLVFLSSLFLGSNQLEGNIPASFGQLRNLSVLFLQINMLTGPLPSSLGNLKQLSSLGLKSNQLSGELPPEIGGMTGLSALDIRDNNFGGDVPPEFANLLNLNNFFLDDNRFTGLPDMSAISMNGRLSVKGNRLTFEDIEPNVGVAKNFDYSPQDSVGARVDTLLEVGSRFVHRIPVGGASNIYKWKRNFINIADATADSLVIDPVDQFSDGSYVLTITNSVATGLALNAQPLNIILPDFLPTVTVNSGIDITEGGWAYISGSNLTVTDVETPATDLIFTIDSSVVKAAGYITVTGDSGDVHIDSTGFFTQTDLNAFRVKFHHDGSEDTLTSIAFNVADSLASINIPNFEIRVAPVNDPPVPDVNLPLLVDEGGIGFITDSLLKVFDVDSDPADISYSILGPPIHGTLYLGDAPYPQWSAFSQTDVDSGRVSYHHNGDESVLDSLQFGVFDKSLFINHPPFYFNINPVNDAPGIFNLFQPSDNTIVNILNSNFGTDSLVFKWNKALDPEGDKVTYRAAISDSSGKILWTADTSISTIAISYVQLVEIMQAAELLTLTGSWDVYATDGTDSTWAENGPFKITIDASTLAILIAALLPEEFALHPAYPNPFNPSTRIRFDLPQATPISLIIYDLIGREIARLEEGLLQPGYHEVVWNGRDNLGRPIASGLYFARMVTPAYVKTIKMVLLK